MKVQIRVSVSDRFVPDSKVNLIPPLSASLASFYRGKKYGKDVEEVEIKFLIVYPVDGYEDWYKPRKPRYIDHKTYKGKPPGLENEIKKRIILELRMPDEKLSGFCEGPDTLSRQLLLNEIALLLKKLDKLIKRKIDFDYQQFYSDFISVSENLA